MVGLPALEGWNPDWAFLYYRWQCTFMCGLWCVLWLRLVVVAEAPAVFFVCMQGVVLDRFNPAMYAYGAVGGRRWRWGAFGHVLLKRPALGQAPVVSVLVASAWKCACAGAGCARAQGPFAGQNSRLAPGSGSPWVHDQC